MGGRQIAALLVLAALPAYTEDPQEDGAGAETLALAAHSEQELPAEITEALLDELRRIFIAAGLEPEWHQMPGMIEITSVWEPVSIYLHGNCRLERADPYKASDGGLAYVERTDGELRPHIHVDCEKLRGFIQRQLTSFDLQRSEWTMGRAIARVIAHELYHYLTKNADHGYSELFASAMPCEVLLKRRVQFLEDEVVELRKATEFARQARRKQRLRAIMGDD
jgi:hypothetical protein